MYRTKSHKECIINIIFIFEYLVTLLKLIRHLLMNIKVIIHEAKEGGYWAEVPSIPGCATQGDNYEELLSNIYEAVEGCLSIDIDNYTKEPNDKILELRV